jgi:DNA polymerase-3 subunit alpha
VSLPSLIAIRVRVGGGAGRASALRGLFERKPGETWVRLKLEKTRDFMVLLDVAARVQPDREFRAEVERICGPESIEVLAS